MQEDDEGREKNRISVCNPDNTCFSFCETNAIISLFVK